MRFDLRKPCEKCPFRTDVKPYLSGPERAQEIVESLGDGGFPCHATVSYDDYDDYGDDESPRVSSPGEQFCAGALVMLEKVDRPGQAMRIAERLGLYDRTKLKMDSPVYGSPEKFIRAQARGREEFGSCSVCGPGCEAPAGYMNGCTVVATPNYEKLENHCEECGEPICNACVEVRGDKTYRSCCVEEEDDD